jgi:hypothetical protein
MSSREETAFRFIAGVVVVLSMLSAMVLVWM